MEIVYKQSGGSTPYKQVIIVRKDLNMSHGKMAAQVSHASMGFLMNMIRQTVMKKMDPSVQACPVYAPTSTLFEQEHGKIRQHYRHPALEKMANDAEYEGETYFFYKKADPDDPFSELIRVTDETLIPYYYEAIVNIPELMYDNWFNSTFTKVILQAKNKVQLLKSIAIAKENGIQYNMIYDNCFTELSPEEPNGTTLTCIGFPPLPEDKAKLISYRYQLYKD